LTLARADIGDTGATDAGGIFHVRGSDNNGSPNFGGADRD
jgi:hypothetical protein